MRQFKFIMLILMLAGCATPALQPKVGDVCMEEKSFDMSLADAMQAADADHREMLQHFQAAFPADADFSVTQDDLAYTIIVTRPSKVNPSGETWSGGAEAYQLDKATGQWTMQWHEHPMRLPDSVEELLDSTEETP